MRMVRNQSLLKLKKTNRRKTRKMMQKLRPSQQHSYPRELRRG
jgi:hypothetical protein